MLRVASGTGKQGTAQPRMLATELIWRRASCFLTGTMRLNRLTLAAATMTLLGVLPQDGRAQSAPTDTTSAKRVTLAPGAQYGAGRFTRIMLGDGWRNVWVVPTYAMVLDPATYAGGLKFDKRGGGRQTITVHFEEKDGYKGYVWRSVDKFPMPSLSREFQGNLVGHIIQDQISSFLPAAPLAVPPLLQALGILHLDPDLYVMGKSPMLGALRDTVGGLLGTFELKPNEAPDDKPGFAGSKKIQDTDEFLEKIRENHNHRLDEREFLASRLIDILINDTDRAPDNYAWARFGDKETGYTWRVIPRDRDWAFVDADGLVNQFITTPIYPKYAKFTRKAKLSALTYTSHYLDRQLLQRLTIRDFQDVAIKVQQSITDQVIARSVSQLPTEWQQAGAASKLTDVMRARRDDIVATAMRMYLKLAEDVDLHGTDLADRVEVVRHNDGRVTVTIGPAAQPVVASTERRADGRVVTETGGEVAKTRDVWYERTFIPPETQELRIYLGKGDDLAVVRGARNKSIRVRVIGEEGNDLFDDQAYAGGTNFYDEEGNNRVAAGPALITKPFEALAPKFGLRVGQAWRPDWGGKRGLGFGFDHKTGAGIIVGAGPKFTTYGFRRMPHQFKGRANLMVAPATGQMGVYGSLDYRMENSPVALTLGARATQIEAIRFYGYGNDTPDIGSRASLVDQRVVSVEPAYVYNIGWRARENGFNQIRGGQGNPEEGEDSVAPRRRIRVTVGKMTVGPTLSWIDPEDAGGTPRAILQPVGSHSYGLAGLKGTLQIDRTDDDAMPTSGFTIRAAAAGYPALMGLDAAFGTLSASTSAYIPIMSGGTHFALRLGGATGVGEVPFQFAPAIGGRSSLRGFSSRRFTGDASANAGVEFRVPVGEVNFILRSKLGVFALADAGRVWLDGSSPGGIHTGVGGGFWLSSLGRSVSVAYAQGEASKFYVRLGQSY